MAVTNPFDALGIRRTDNDEAVKKQIRKLLMAHHPDHNGSSPQAARRFKYLMRAAESASKERGDPINVTAWMELFDAGRQIYTRMLMLPWEIGFNALSSMTNNRDEPSSRPDRRLQLRDESPLRAA